MARVYTQIQATTAIAWKVTLELTVNQVCPNDTIGSVLGLYFFKKVHCKIITNNVALKSSNSQLFRTRPMAYRSWPAYPTARYSTD